MHSATDSWFANGISIQPWKCDNVNDVKVIIAMIRQWIARHLVYVNYSNCWQHSSLADDTQTCVNDVDIKESLHIHIT